MPDVEPEVMQRSVQVHGLGTHGDSTVLRSPEERSHDGSMADTNVKLVLDLHMCDFYLNQRAQTMQSKLCIKVSQSVTKHQDVDEILQRSLRGGDELCPSK